MGIIANKLFKFWDSNPTFMGLKLKETYPGNRYYPVLHFRSEAYLFQGKPIDQYVPICQRIDIRDTDDSPLCPVRFVQDKMISVVSQALLNN